MINLAQRRNWRWGLLALALVVVLSALPRPAWGQAGNSVYELSLADLGYTTVVLRGPGDSVSYYFSLPANWSPQVGSSLSLDLAYAAGSQAGLAPAILEVRLNNTVLYTERLSQSVVTTLKIALPPQAMRLAEESYLNELELNLTVDTTCDEAMLTTLTVQPDSRLSFVYRQRPMTLDLMLYPKPLYYSRSWDVSPAHVLLPPQPTAHELTAAAMIAANLGAQTRHTLPLEASLASSPPAAAVQQHVLAIGSIQRMPFLAQLDLPLPVRQRRLSLRSQMPASIDAGQPFSYTLLVENTSGAAQNVVVHDRLPPQAQLEPGQPVSMTTPGVVHWPLPTLSPGQIASVTLYLRLDDPASLSGVFEHTASLLDAAGQVINVDTLTTSLALETSPAVVSSPAKSDYFFAWGEQAIPETDGIVQLVASPWNAQRAIVAVTGLSDAAVLRAAYALATREDVPGMRGPFAVVQAARPAEHNAVAHAQDVSLAELGYADIQIKGYAGEVRLQVSLPRGATWPQEPSMALHLAHGSALDVLSATLELSLNDLPFYSIRLQANNAVDHWIEIPLPAHRLKPGVNQLAMRAVADWPSCPSNDVLSRLWVVVYADSYWHLPYARSETGGLFDLADYPRLVSPQPGLHDLALMLPAKVTPDEVSGLVQLLSYLGYSAGGDYFTPQVALGDVVTADRWRDRHWIVLGQPSRNPYIQLVNDHLPQPFIPGSDEIQQQVGNVIYRWPPGYDLGIIQLLPVPDNPKRAILIATGTTHASSLWALRALSDSELSQQLSGNLAVLTQADALRATDTRQLASTSTESVGQVLLPRMTPEPALTPTATAALRPSAPATVITPTVASSPVLSVSLPVDGQAQSAVSSRPGWLLPLLAASILVVITAVGIAVRQAR